MRFRKHIPWLCSCSLACLAALTASAQTNSPSKPIVTEDTRYAALATKLQAKNVDFDHIFQDLCQMVITTVNTNAKTRLDDQVRAMFGGLWLWCRNGGTPAFQGQNDKADRKSTRLNSS